jgi:hypothetical protein
MTEPVPDVSDLTRNARDRQFLVDLLHRQAQSKDPRIILNTIWRLIVVGPASGGAVGRGN